MEALFAGLRLDDCSEAQLAGFPPEIVAILLRQLNGTLEREGPLTVAEATQRLGVARVNHLWRQAALAEIRLCLRITHAAELSSPLLEAMRVRALHLQPAIGQPPAELEHALLALLQSPAFQQRSGGTLAALHGLPSGALDSEWSSILAPFAELEEVGFALLPHDSYDSLTDSALGNAWLGRFRTVRLATRDLYIEFDAPPDHSDYKRQVPHGLLSCLVSEQHPGFESQGLHGLLSCLTPMLQGTAIRRLAVEAANVSVALTYYDGYGYLQWSPCKLVTAMQGPAAETATLGCLTGTITRPAPSGKAGMLLLEVASNTAA